MSTNQTFNLRDKAMQVYKRLLLILSLAPLGGLKAQLAPLTVEKIMRDQKWIGTSPDGIRWQRDSKVIYFDWNPTQSVSDSLYFVKVNDWKPQITPAIERADVRAYNSGNYNPAKTAYTYAKDGDIFYLDLKKGKTIQVTHTTGFEFNPQFCLDGEKIVYMSQQNLYAWDIANGTTSQLTNFVSNAPKSRETKKEKKDKSSQEDWLKDQQLALFDVLKEEKAEQDAREAFMESLPDKKGIYPIAYQDRMVTRVNISPDGRFVNYTLYRDAKDKNTMVPSWVNESGYVTEINARPKVGSPQGSYETFIFDREKDTAYALHVTDIPGIKDIPAYRKDYPQDSSKPSARGVIVNGPFYSENGQRAIVDIRSQDNKDRWIMSVELASGKLQTLDRQHDDAWIAGPGLGWSMGGGNIGWIDENTCWFQSEVSGYSHLYTYNFVSKKTNALTSGKFEVQEAKLSADKKTFYITTNEVHPGEQQFYHLNIANKKLTRITQMTGANEVSVSPDEKWIAFRYSYSNKPWELYVQENKAGAKAIQVTGKAMSDEFKSYPWRDPEVITFQASDGQEVYARLYQPATGKKNGAAVIFVHGAGYLQNAHKWWSSYSREYMFHNLLADRGFTVIDVDYRGSAGYGRDVRTGIYRHMGGKDLDDQVDAAALLVKKYGIDPKRIGIYGGSYGGFITLMAMFTKPGTFAAGAALRSVTDWAHYNHGYTSNILNEPQTDSIAYARSSPINFAAGLQGKLLMCHGMVDTNVHFQDIVRLSQRLIELGKDNWELAVYPVENHGFTKPSSWTDEYKRILKLFEETLL